MVKTCFDAFSSHQNQVLYKLFFSPLEWVKTCFYAFPGQQNQVPKKLIFHVWGGQKRVFKHLRILPDHQNHVLTLKIIYLTSGVVKNVFWWFPHHPIQVLKNCFLTSVVVKKRVLMHFQTTRIKSLKIIFSPLEWLKTCFYAFPGHQNRVLKKLFFHLWSG